jgi:DNA-binding transcriptional MocR family regulator
MVDSVNKHFPQSVSVHVPKGGFFIWIRLPDYIDAMELHMAAHRERVSIAPGPMFSASGGMRNYIRLNAGRIWTPEIEHGISTLGKLIHARECRGQHVSHRTANVGSGAGLPTADDPVSA